MTEFEPEVAEAIQRFSDALSEKYPEVGEVIAALQAGEMDEATAMKRLMRFVAEEEASPDIEGLAADAFSSLRSEEAFPVPFERPEAPVKGEPPPIVYEDGPLRRLNPLVEAAIAEQAQFDGDVPVMRSGELPEGARPAVPVETTARDPIAIGAMLETASAEVEEEIEKAKEEHVAKAKQIAEIAESQGLGGELAIELFREQLPDAAPTGVPGYEAGKVPEKRSVVGPSGSALAKMTPEERKRAAFKVLSTTQGRRSAKPVIEELILAVLASEGFEMNSRPEERAAGNIEVYAEWSMNLGGPMATQSNFSFLDTAAKAIGQKLAKILRERSVEHPVLEVTTIDAVDLRRVGWAARVVSKEVTT
jgi:hypothetical protein